MSRIGKKPVKIPEGVSVNVNGQTVTITGPKGSLSLTFRPEIKVESDGQNITLQRKDETAKAKAVHGLSRTLLENMVTGTVQGWNKGLELVGVGYRAAVEGKDLVLNVGFSHPVKFPAPGTIEFEVVDNTRINVKGVDKQLVGETAAKIRRIRPPEPYKGKGVRYVGEVIRKKAGKAAAKATAAVGAK